MRQTAGPMFGRLHLHRHFVSKFSAIAEPVPDCGVGLFFSDVRDRDIPNFFDTCVSV
jgi:hypothetical protein